MVRDNFDQQFPRPLSKVYENERPLRYRSDTGHHGTLELEHDGPGFDFSERKGSGHGLLLSKLAKLTTEFTDGSLRKVIKRRWSYFSWFRRGCKFTR